MAVSYSGGSLGAVVAPLIVIPIAARFGWRGAFVATGVIGALWLMLWSRISQRPALSQRPEPAALAAARIRITDRRVWGFVIAYAFCALPLGFVANLSGVYLNRAHGISQAALARVLWIPPLGWEIGYFFWGYLLDRMLSEASAPPQVLRIYRWLFGVLIVLTLPFALGARLPFNGVVAELLFEDFIAAGFVIGVVRYATGLFSAANAGLIAGLTAGGWGLVVGLVTPYLGRLFDARRWDEAFWICTALPVCGYLAWLVLSRGPGLVLSRTTGEEKSA
jgi:MFS transporter, ACS family, hexuronate transporter